MAARLGHLEEVVRLVTKVRKKYLSKALTCAANNNQVDAIEVIVTARSKDISEKDIREISSRLNNCAESIKIVKAAAEEMALQKKFNQAVQENSTVEVSALIEKSIPGKWIVPALEIAAENRCLEVMDQILSKYSWIISEEGMEKINTKLKKEGEAFSIYIENSSGPGGSPKLGISVSV